MIDAVYEGGSQGNAADDPISKILEGVGNQGGFRAAGRGPDKKYVVLYTSGEEKDWPDTLDLSTGQFTYFGDNRRPGHQLHETPRKGNEILRRAFEFLHASPPMRAGVPPFFIFKWYPTRKPPIRAVQRISGPWVSWLAVNSRPSRCLENDGRATLSKLSRDFHGVGRSRDCAFVAA
jgi:hypothetical protein